MKSSFTKCNSYNLSLERHRLYLDVWHDIVLPDFNYLSCIIESHSFDCKLSVNVEYTVKLPF